MTLKDRRALVNGIAKERIEILFGLAESALPKDKDLAGSYVYILNKIRTHYKVNVPPRIKNRICGGCSSLLLPGLNCRVIVVSSGGYLTYRCLACGTDNHIRYRT